MPFHKDFSVGENHIIHNAVYATYSDAAADTFGAEDLGKVIKLTDQNSYYIVLDTTPTFGLINGGITKTLQTTDATETAVYSLTTTTDYTYLIEAHVIGTVDTGGNSAGYRRIACFKNDSGTLTQVGSTAAGFTAENDSAWDCQIEVPSGVTLAVRVTGAAATTINWQVWVKVLAMYNGA